MERTLLFSQEVNLHVALVWTVKVLELVIPPKPQHQNTDLLNLFLLEVRGRILLQFIGVFFSNFTSMVLYLLKEACSA